MIDRQLNYGRFLIADYLRQSCPFKSVLDLGAGSGVDLSLARGVDSAAQLHAVEAFPANVQKLRKSGISVVSLNIENERLPFEDGQIDVVIANQVLEHTKEIFWIFHEISRVLPVGGKLIIGVPNLAAFHNRLLLAFGRQPSPIKTNSAHVRGFTKHDLLRFLEVVFSDGYRLRSFGGSNFYPFPPFLARPLAAAFPGLAWGIFLLLEKRKGYNGEFLRYPKSEQLETNFFLG